MLTFKDLKYVNGFRTWEGGNDYTLMFYSYTIDNYFRKLKELDEARYYKMKSEITNNERIQMNSHMIEYHYEDLNKDITETDNGKIEQNEKFMEISDYCKYSISKIIVSLVSPKN